MKHDVIEELWELIISKTGMDFDDQRDKHLAKLFFILGYQQALVGMENMFDDPKDLQRQILNELNDLIMHHLEQIMSAEMVRQSEGVQH